VKEIEKEKRLKRKNERIPAEDSDTHLSQGAED
jgi:hypothetical protein